jgi:hypothetical protein
MTENSQSEKVPARTPEQHAAVRRRALPVGVAGAALGLASVLMPLTVRVTAFMPPNLLGVNLAFCAMLMGAGMLFYAKGTPGTRTAVVASLLAIVLGMAGTLTYTWQAVQSRQARETLELDHVQAVAKAAAAYAGTHEGAYPADLLAMLEGGQLNPQALQSPFGRCDPLFNDFARARAGLPRQDFLKSVETAADYLYLGGDLKNVPPDVAGGLLVAVSTNTVMRVSLAVACADGKSRFITLEEVPGVVAACNAARRKIGLGELRPPAIIQAAINEAKSGKNAE